MSDTATYADGTAQARYHQLCTERDVFLRRAEDASKLTIPSLMPPEGHSGSTKLYEPYQSVGSRGVNNLAAKSMLSLFPPSTSFFRLSLDDKVLDDLAQTTEPGQEQEDAKTVIEAGLAKVEKAVITRLEQVGARAPLYDAKRHLIVCGNVMLEVMPKGYLRCHYLNRYVVKRDPMGNPVEILVLEKFAKATLPEQVRRIVELEDTERALKGDRPSDNVIDVYTHVKLDGELWTQYQEVCGKKIPDTDGTYKRDKSPWIPLRYTRIEGESYGRGMVEDYMGDLRSLEALSQSLVEFAGIAANIKFLIDPSGVTKAADLARTRNGGFVKGSLKDIGVLGLEKFADFRVAKETADTIEKRLGEAFLLGSAAVRDAERVTAEEIRLIAGELEQGLGGFYSLMAVELQLPLVSRYLFQMQRDRDLPKLPEGSVKPSIVTGMEALGRGGDLQKLDTLLAGVEQLFGADALAQRVNIGAYIIRRGTALGIPDLKGLIRSDAEVQQAQQQATAKELLGKLGPQMVKNSQEAQSAPPGADPNAQGTDAPQAA